MTDEMKALPCAFCGGHAIAENYVIEAATYCTKCRATIIRRHQPHADTGLPEAIAAWNCRAPTEGQWRPIESAPRDGTSVLIYSRPRGVEKSRWIGAPHNYWAGGLGHKITHFQPLPPPPGQGEG